MRQNCLLHTGQRNIAQSRECTYPIFARSNYSFIPILTVGDSKITHWGKFMQLSKPN